MRLADHLRAIADGDPSLQHALLEELSEAFERLGDDPSETDVASVLRQAVFRLRYRVTDRPSAQDVNGTASGGYADPADVAKRLGFPPEIARDLAE